MKQLAPLLLFALLFGCHKKPEPQTAIPQPENVAVKTDSVQPKSGDSAKVVATDSSDSNDEEPTINNYLTDATADSKEVTTIDKPCVIFVEMSDSEWDAESKTMSEEDMNTVGDDNAYYTYTASEICDSLNLKTETVKTRFLKLKGSKELLVDLRKEKRDMPDLILFSPNKEPKLQYRCGLERDSVSEYFKE